MKEKFNGKLKIIIIFTALFLVILTLLLLIFNEGKKSYTVRFELDGGTLLGGSLEQTVIHGQDAIPPKVVKDGAYLHSWSASYKNITKDMVIEAVWEYETTAGIIYADSENQNYTEIIGAFKHLQGEVYLGAYHGEKKVLGIGEGAFSNCLGITKVYLLDGLLSIGQNAFSGCTSLEEIEIPETVARIGGGAFQGCEALEKLVLNEGLKKIGPKAFADCTSLTEVTVPKTVTVIGDGAFQNCEELETLVLSEGIEEIGANAFAGCTNLKTVILPKSVKKISADAFAGCDGLIIKVKISEQDIPEDWAAGWNGGAEIEWDFEEEIVEDGTVDNEETAA